MFNFYESKLQHPERFRLLRCGDSLITFYNCPLENKFADIWSQHNYIVYVQQGRKIWHTAHGSYELQEGDCVFVKKGACIVEQFFDATFCLVIFFIPDQFICGTLQTKSNPITKTGKKYDPVIPINKTERLESFFSSMFVYFNGAQEPDPTLLELKFRELILTMADNPQNKELLSYFCSLLQEPQTASLQRVMEDNHCFNLKLEERLHHAMHLLKHLDKTVSEAAFESGFENSSHFSRSFKERFGVTPAAMRQKEYSLEV